MPTAGYNAATMRTKLRFLLQAVWSGASDPSGFDSDALLLRLINEARIALAREIGFSWGRSTSTLTSGTGSYSMPADRQGQAVRSVRILDDAGTTESEIPRYTFQEFQRRFDVSDIAAERDAPVGWSVDPSDQTKIMLRPVPDYTIANGLVFYYDSVPTPLHRIFNNSSFTSDPVYGSAAVDIDGGVLGTGLILANDEYGAVLPEQTDGTDIEGEIELPGVWYKISAVVTGSGPGLTLSESYAGPDLAACKFITAQVCPMEIAYPGVLQDLPVELARALYLQSRDFENGSKIVRELLSDARSRIRPDRQGAQTPKSRPRQFTNFHRT